MMFLGVVEGLILLSVYIHLSITMTVGSPQTANMDQVQKLIKAIQD